MNGRTHFTAEAARAEREAKAAAAGVAPYDAVQGVVSIIERDLGAGVNRTEFITNGLAGRRYWPALHAWPDDVVDALLNAARRWLAEHTECDTIGTMCMVEDRNNPPLLVLTILHRPAQAASSAAPLVRDEEPPPEERGSLLSSPLEAAPIHCRAGGCGE